MNNPTISVIVPVYNVEPYLRQCLDSIVNQTYPNIEILIVDDGSPDRCGEICDEYAENDSRITVIHQENAGLSAARNAALDIARGEYIMFVDSDDWVEPTFCEKALEMALEYQVEIAIFGYYSTYQNKSIPCVTSTPRILDGTETIRHIILKDELSFCNAVWNKIYHKRLFRNLRFPVGMLYEDNAFTYKILDSVSYLYVSDLILYNYRRRKNSIDGSFNRKSVKNQSHIFLIRNERLAFLKKHYPDPELIKQQTLDLTHRLITYRSRLNKNNPEERRCYDLMTTFLKENKAYLLSLPCDKYTRIYLHSEALYHLYLKLAKMKGILYSWIKPQNKRKINVPSTPELEYFL